VKPEKFGSIPTPTVWQLPYLVRRDKSFLLSVSVPFSDNID
jgi:hypothetical protein